MQFVKDSTQIARLLTNLLKRKNKSQGIKWSIKYDHSFLILKNVLTFFPVKVIDPSVGAFVLCINGSDLAIGVVLM